MSKTFEEICKFQIGEDYWESSQMGNIHFEVISKPTVYPSSIGTQVRFVGKDLDTGEPIHYLFTENHMHYGASIYDEPAYITTKELRKLTEEAQKNGEYDY